MKFDVTDPAHRAVLEAARAWGVAPSIFMGRRVRSVFQEHDGARSILSDPLWLDEDLQAALDLRGYEADLCPGCLQPLAETTAAGNEGRYVAALAIRCHRCTATDQAAEAAQSSPNPSALLIPIELRQPVLDNAQVEAEPV